jgi:hypothetical protein
MKLTQSLNRTVLVAIPAFFGDDQTRACKLVDVEIAGLWLAFDELQDRLGPAYEISPDWAAPVIGFFPFCQILYIIDPSQFADLVNRRKPAPDPTPPPPKDVKHEYSDTKGRPKHKDSKSRR